MFDTLSSLKSLIKLDSVCIDNNVFRLHYKGTVVILIAFSLLVTSRQYIGDPIDCIVDASIGGDIMDTYCWIHSTYTLLDKLDGKIGVDVPHPGISSLTSKSDNVKYHKYYQWVCFVLFFQALLFYIPRYLWKTWEGGRMKMLVMDLSCPIVDDEKKRGMKKLLVNYFIINMKFHNIYSFSFVFCEVLNFINVVGQIFFMDVFLGNEFTTYGIDVLAMTEQDPLNRIDPMAKVFPKVTKCTFRKFGPAGSVVPYDGLCVLPLNAFNEKIYVFLWFWFITVAIISGVGLICRVATVFGPQIRMYLLRAQNRLSEQRHIDRISKMCQFGDWFVLYQLGKNLDPLIYREVIEDLSLNDDFTALVAVLEGMTPILPDEGFTAV